MTLLNLQFNLMQINCYITNAIAIATVTGLNYFQNLKLSCRVTAPSAQTD